MEIVEDKKEWQELTQHSPFLQSWEWGDFQEAAGFKVWRIGVRQENKLIAGAVVIQRNLPMGLNWIYVPRGFVCAEEIWPELERALIELAHKERAIFIKIEPSWKVPGWKTARTVQPQHTVVLDLHKREEELLNGMHQKTRYNIRLAERKGVRTEFAAGEKMVDVFLQLSREVEERSEFKFHPDDYYRKMQSVLSPAGLCEIGVAYLNDQPLAAHVLVNYGGVTTYVHGASSSLSRSVMAPVLLQWNSIKRAQEQGMRQYDFYGVAPENADKTHPWAGITRFKLGFGGQRIDYPDALDYPVKKGWYELYKLGRRLV